MWWHYGVVWSHYGVVGCNYGVVWLHYGIVALGGTMASHQRHVKKFSDEFKLVNRDIF